MRDLSQKVSQLLRDDPFLPVYTVVANVLHDEIGSCRILPGEHLREIDTAEKMGVSRTTVRRAFEVLELEGRVVRRQASGVEVAPMMEKKYREIAELRVMLDSHAARLAAIRRSESDLACMRACIVRLKCSADADSATHADIDFHQCIYRATGNESLLQIVQEFDLDITHLKYLSVQAVLTIRPRIIAEHAAICRAIQDQDPKRAFQTSVRHANILFDPILLAQAFPDSCSRTED